VRALYEIVTENHFAEAITQDGLIQLRDHVVDIGRMDRVELQALKASRAPVLPGGLSILLGLMRELSVQRVDPADGALRLGVLYDLIGRKRNGRAHASDTRERTIDRLQRRYDVDTRQAERVAAIAQSLWRGASDEHDDDAIGWAARLLEIGMTVAHEDYHRHSAYLIAHSDLPGFSERERSLVGALVLGHTGSLKKLDRTLFEGKDLLRLLCIRIAAIFAHGRSDSDERLSFAVANDQFDLTVDAQLSERRPLTQWLLEEERERCAKWGVELRVNS
jgi:exopolyphosphatase / guanosine-5'-triphosphate,3'-diphosphate pyrophosphatase